MQSAPTPRRVAAIHGSQGNEGVCLPPVYHLIHCVLHQGGHDRTERGRQVRGYLHKQSTGFKVRASLAGLSHLNTVHVASEERMNRQAPERSISLTSLCTSTMDMTTENAASLTPWSFIGEPHGMVTNLQWARNQQARQRLHIHAGQCPIR